MPDYSKETIIKSLLLAPCALLILLTLSFMYMNNEFRFQSIPFILAANALIYCIYCVFTIPISYTCSMLLAGKNQLNIVTIITGSVLTCFLITLMGYLIFTHSLPEPLSRLLTDWFFYSFAVFTGICYWGLLHYFQRKSSRASSA